MKTKQVWILILSMALSGCASGYYQAGYGGYSANAYAAPRSAASFEYGYVAPAPPIVHYDSLYVPPRHSIPMYRGYRWHDEGGGHRHRRNYDHLHRRHH